jgi:uncharacterized repeat protein (TIGR03803 family)
MTSTRQCQTSMWRIGRYLATALAVLLVPMLATQSVRAQTYKVLYTSGGPPDAAGPVPPLIRDAAGNFYGNAGGGTSNEGAVFRLDTAGAETVLYSFPYVQNPYGGLVSDTVGNLYGTVQSGFNVDPPHCGYIFKLDPTGQATTLYTFSGGADGCQPSLLVRDSDGNFYGATAEGGDLNCVFTSPPGCGTIFKLDATGQLTTLYAFQGDKDGIAPNGLIRDPAGNFYGTTYFGGPTADQPLSGFGTVFKLDTTGTKTTLYGFTNGADGQHPVGVIRDNAGYLYGTTWAGGSSGRGTVFKLDTTGHLTVLYSFPNIKDGTGPAGGLILDPAG